MRTNSLFTKLVVERQTNGEKLLQNNGRKTENKHMNVMTDEVSQDKK